MTAAWRTETVRRRTTVEPPYVGSGQLEKLTGASYRQVDYWRRNGAIIPAIGDLNIGSGGRCGWSPRDVARLVAIVDFLDSMTKLGASRVELDTIAAIWDGLAFKDTVELGDDTVRVVVRLPEHEEAA